MWDFSGVFAAGVLHILLACLSDEGAVFSFPFVLGGTSLEYAAAFQVGSLCS